MLTISEAVIIAQARERQAPSLRTFTYIYSFSFHSFQYDKRSLQQGEFCKAESVLGVVTFGTSVLDASLLVLADTVLDVETPSRVDVEVGLPGFAGTVLGTTASAAVLLVTVVPGFAGKLALSSGRKDVVQEETR